MTAAGTLVLALALTPTPPAGAVNNNPSGNPTSPAVSYENDCIGTTSTGAIQDAPLVTSTVIDTTTGTNNVLPQGATFGVAGTVTQTLAGAVIAGANELANGVFGAPPSSFNISATETFGPTDNNSTGSYTYTTPSFAAQANPGGVVTGVTFSSGSTTLSGDFSGIPADAAVYGAGIPLTAVSTAAGTSTSITISAATTAASTGETIGWAPFSGLTFTDSSFATPATAFTTAAATTVAKGTAGIGLTSVSKWTFYLTTSAGTLPGANFGGGGNGAGASGTNTCIETGYVNSTTPGPALYSQPGPMLPPGLTTPLVATATTGSGATLDSVPTDFQPGAYANLGEPAPVAKSETVSMGTGQSTTITLPTVPGNSAYPVASCALVAKSISNTGGGSVNLTVAISNSPTVCQATLTDSDTAPETYTFQFTATNDYGTPETSAPGTITVSVGTPPVAQPISETVNPGLLVLSCSAPGTSGYPTLGCGTINMPSVTLNGLAQTKFGAANPIFVSDNRGNPAVGWSLTASMIPSSLKVNSNKACATVAAFCDSTVGSHASNPNGQIAAKYLSIKLTGWNAYSGTLNAAPSLTGTGGNFGTTVSLGSAAAGESGGTFVMHATYSLYVPASVYAGTYIGTVEYLVS
ncbi:MAG: hypothetical protein M0040_05930 [Actinomycetota bacterium]|nr:hypothetical protein [Actinomycetota bacterium]